MQTFNGGSDLSQHAILHNTSISNMKFIPHTHSCIHQSGLQKGFRVLRRNFCQPAKKQAKPANERGVRGPSPGKF